MKFFVFTAVLSICLYFPCQSQVPSNYNADNESRGRQPLGQFLFQQMGSRNKNFEKKPEIIGSPFISENFEETKIYSQDGFEGDIYSRYDGYNEELQLKKSLNDETVSVLLKRADIYCVVGSVSIVFKEFYNKKNMLANGYLFKLVETENFILFERKLKRYKDGKEAVNSLQMDVKNRFVSDSELYVLKEGDKKIEFLKSNKKQIIGLFEEGPVKTDSIKKYISRHKLNLKETSEVLKVLTYYQTL